MKKIIYSVLCSQLLFSCFKKEATVANSISMVDSTASGTIDSAASVADSAVAMVDSAATAQNSAHPEPAKTAMTYDEAKRINSSEAWKQFLADNPNYDNKKEIEDEIIRAEVREISSDKNTGQMPTAEKISSSGKSASIMEVENNTSCDLTILYSGPDAKRVVIAPNSKQTVSLASGSYSVAANACGYNYAGSETLSGDYNVTYYISSVRY